MKHFVIDANPELIPFFEDLYQNQHYDFTLHYGDGPHYLLTSNQENFYALALLQNGAREINQSEISDAFLNLHNYNWLGNPQLVQPQL